jgi:hypothetical protein
LKISSRNFANGVNSTTVISVKTGGTECKTLLKAVSSLPDSAQVALVKTVATKVVVEWHQTSAWRDGLVALMLNDDFGCYIGQITLLLQHINDQQAIYDEENCKYQVAADNRAAAAALERASQNKRVATGSIIGGVGGGIAGVGGGAAAGAAIGAIGGPAGAALGAGIGILAGALAGGGVAHATRARPS